MSEFAAFQPKGLGPHLAPNLPFGVMAFSGVIILGRPLESSSLFPICSRDCFGEQAGKMLRGDGCGLGKDIA